MSIFLSYYISNWRCYKLVNNFTRNTKFLYTNKRINNSGVNLCRQFSQDASIPLEENGKFIPFLDVINLRRAEAKRSILVQVQSAKSFKELHTYCSCMGTVKHMFHYSTGVEPLHFIIVEFAQESDVTNILGVSSHIDESQGVPTQSQFLWFRASNRKLAKLKQNKNYKLIEEDGTNVLKNSDITDLLKNCESVSDQMVMLRNVTKLNDVGIRLRFLTSRQIELAVSGMFPHASTYPFGSSVNGYGKMGCDLDLVLKLADKKEDEDSRLIFHCKATAGSERTTSQRHIDAIADIIHLFLPGCAQVRRILQARVPIIKFHQQLTDVECDLSMTNLSGVHMSDFLYIMGSVDVRVRPLIFAVRKWAEEVGLTNSSPGRWISNFSLTLLVLAFLQKPLNSSPILPTLNTLTKLAGPNDKYVTEDGIDCTFLRDINKLNHKTTNTDSLEALLSEFFEYYSQFDFSQKAVCLNEAVSLTKPEYSPMYIVNPIERGLNVSKNVSLEEVERFKLEVRNAAWLLESREEKVSNWGLLSIFESDRKKVNYNLKFAMSARQRRLMEVSTLFVEDQKTREEDVDFKNENLKQQVKSIKRETQEKLKLLENVKRQNSQR